MSPIDRVLGALGRHGPVRPCGAGWKSHCPAHDDRVESLSVGEGDDGRVLLRCHAGEGCAAAAIVAALGLAMSDLRGDGKGSFASCTPGRSERRGPDGEGRAGYGAANARGSDPRSQTGGAGRQARRKIEEVYNYRDEEGRLLYQVVRFDPKGFAQRRPDGSGEWVWKLDGVRRVLYRLPELVAAIAAGRTVYVVEGEKDADRLAALGLAATTSPGGAGKWDVAYAETVRGAVVGAVLEVVVLPDNDDAGRAHAAAVAGSLDAVGVRVRVVSLPGLAEKGDVSDWLAAGGSIEGIEAMAAQTPYWAPPEGDGPGELLVGYALTDSGNAERFVSRYGVDVGYCAEWKWIRWDGRRWVRDEEAWHERLSLEVMRALREEAREIGDPETRAEVFRHAYRSEQVNRRMAMLRLAQSDPGVRTSIAQFDRDRWAWNCANGTLDLRSGEPRPHRREDRITRLSPAEYDPDAECPTWERFLAEIMAGNDDLVAFLQRAVGYAMTGETSEQVLFLLYGTGANGKSTFLETLRTLFGDYAQQAGFETFLERQDSTVRNDLAKLAGARLVSAVEIGGGRHLNEELIKRATGGDAITARYLYCEEFTFEPTFKLFLAANHRPKISGTDHGIWRRQRLIPFEVTIVNPDRDLGRKLRAEMPGILRWALEGCLFWQAIGLEPPVEVIEATQAYRAEMDQLAGFLDECCVVNPNVRVGAAQLFGAYGAWCERSGERRMSIRAFKGALEERGFESTRGGDNGAKLWYGIGLVAPTSDDVAPEAREEADG